MEQGRNHGPFTKTVRTPTDESVWGIMQPLAVSGEDSVGSMPSDPRLKHGCRGAHTSMTKDHIIKSQHGGACAHDALAYILALVS